jgi:hypothetical protein
MDKDIVIVSGLPRSGTSLCMRMLDVGGMDVLTDNIRRPDIDNPNGYYEYELAKKIKEDRTWLPPARGKAFKMVSMLLYDLPKDFRYKILFMTRNMSEILVSQTKMLKRLNRTGAGTDDERMAALFSRHLKEVKHWLHEQPNIDVLYIDYAELITQPVPNAQRICTFLECQLSADKMAAVVDTSLYRNRTDSVSREAVSTQLACGR